MKIGVKFAKNALFGVNHLFEICFLDVERNFPLSGLHNT